jgi:hypothetical protein
MRTSHLLLPLLLAVLFSTQVLAQGPQLEWVPVQTSANIHPTAFATSPNGTVFAAAPSICGYLSATFYESTDHGLHWNYLSSVGTGYTVTSIVTLSDSILFAYFDWDAPDGCDTNLQSGSGLQFGSYVSSDAGKSWLGLAPI